jgi:hypothetical protein
MTTGILLQVGAMVTLTKVISEADVALFTLVTNDRLPATDEPLTLDEGEPGPVPGALVAALLACAAVRVAGGHPRTTIARAEVRCLASAQPDDALTVTAEVTAFDGGACSVSAHAHCVDQRGRHLADGSFELHVGE